MVGFAAPLLLAGGNALRFGIPKLAQRYAPGVMNYGRGLLNTTTKVPTAPVSPPPTILVNRAGQAYSPIPSSNALVPYKSFPRLRNAFLTPEGKIRKGRALGAGLGGYIGGGVVLDTIGNQFGGDDSSSVGTATEETTEEVKKNTIELGKNTQAKLDNMNIQNESLTALSGFLNATMQLNELLKEEGVEQEKLNTLLAKRANVFKTLS